jgi:phosphoenolpyruvate phosphomutase
MSESLAVTRVMIEASQLPVIVDADAGYGDVPNVVRSLRQYESAGAAAICMEDNLFPKRNSFYDSGRRRLASAEEHATKIRAAKDAQRSSDFVVIARTEAFIAGLGIEEALERAHAYADAGADLCLIHSKSKRPDEVLDFAVRWDRPTPLVCVPTTYATASVDQLHAGGYKVVIFANHAMRSAVKAMQVALNLLYSSGRAAAIDDLLVPLGEVSRLTGEPDLRALEARYAPVGVPLRV